jgi:6-phosphogluconolactonase (cycloisomerase 2 family)
MQPTLPKEETMRFTARLTAALVAALVIAGALAGGALAHGKRHRPLPRPNAHAAAVFVQTNDPAGNSVVALDRRPDGTLEEAGSYPTGGLGGALDGAEVDHLASQGALTLDSRAGLLYAVNAGSDTVTVFAVRGDSLRRVQLIGSGGDFPVSITTHGHLVYVLNAREGGSVQGFVRIGDRLHRVGFWHRDLGLDPSAEPEFVNTPGQVAFTPAGRQLVVTTKANGHSVDVFRVLPFGGLSASPTVTALPGQVPFALEFDAAGHLLVGEAAGAVESFSIAGDGSLTSLDKQVTGGAATCWIVGSGNRFWASNTGSGTLSGYLGSPGGTLTPLGDTATGPAPIDAAASADGRFLYVQTGADGGVDQFRINGDGSLTPLGSIVVPGTAGGEGIAAS